jgi:hypothetical protein
MAAAMTFDYLLTSERSTRLIDQNPDDHQGEQNLPSLRTVFRETTAQVLPTGPGATVSQQQAPPDRLSFGCLWFVFPPDVCVVVQCRTGGFGADGSTRRANSVVTSQAIKTVYDRTVLSESDCL